MDRHEYRAFTAPLVLVLIEPAAMLGQPFAKGCTLHRSLPRPPRFVSASIAPGWARWLSRRAQPEARGALAPERRAPSCADRRRPSEAGPPRAGSWRRQDPWRDQSRTRGWR